MTNQREIFSSTKQILAPHIIFWAWIDAAAAAAASPAVGEAAAAAVGDAAVGAGVIS